MTLPVDLSAIARRPVPSRAARLISSSSHERARSRVKGSLTHQNTAGSARISATSSRSAAL